MKFVFIWRNMRLLQSPWKAPEITGKPCLFYCSLWIQSNFGQWQSRLIGTKNVKGKKTDVLDCQWIQKLHSLGLLEGSFIPDYDTEKLQHYCRHRQSLMEDSASLIPKMQKTFYFHLLHPAKTIKSSSNTPLPNPILGFLCLKNCHFTLKVYNLVAK